MKRRTFPVGRSGISPYFRYNKVPFRYSTGYYSWFRSLVGRAAKEDSGKERSPRRVAA